METHLIDREVFFSIKDYKDSRSTLGEFLGDFLSWSDENAEWFDDNYNLAINYYFNRVKLEPLPSLHSFKVIMNQIMSGKVIATYDQDKNKIKNKYRYNASGMFEMDVNGFWAVIRPDNFFELNKEIFIIAPKEEK